METDVIGHLVDVEHKASTILEDAQKEASKRVDEAKVKADALFKSEYVAIVKNLEVEFDEKSKAYKGEHEKELEYYKASIQAHQIDKVGFENFLNSVFFEV